MERGNIVVKCEDDSGRKFRLVENLWELMESGKASSQVPEEHARQYWLIGDPRHSDDEHLSQDSPTFAHESCLWLVHQENADPS